MIVQPDNDAPVVVNPAADIMVNEDAGDVVIALMGTDTAPYFADSDGDSLLDYEELEAARKAGTLPDAGSTRATVSGSPRPEAVSFLRLR